MWQRPSLAGTNPRAVETCRKDVQIAIFRSLEIQLSLFSECPKTAYLAGMRRTHHSRKSRDHEEHHWRDNLRMNRSFVFRASDITVSHLYLFSWQPIKLGICAKLGYQKPRSLDLSSACHALPARWICHGSVLFGPQLVRTPASTFPGCEVSHDRAARAPAKHALVGGLSSLGAGETF